MTTLNELIKYFSKLFVWFVVVQPWEQGLRVRAGKNKKTLSPGVYLNIPYLDSFYVRSTRLHIDSMPVQTISAKDGKVCTLKITVGYRIVNLLETFEAADGIKGVIMSSVMKSCLNLLSSKDASQIVIEELQNDIHLSVMQECIPGVMIDQVNIIDFAFVKTLRIIKDEGWFPYGNDLEEKRTIQ